MVSGLVERPIAGKSNAAVSLIVAFVLTSVPLVSGCTRSDSIDVARFEAVYRAGRAMQTGTQVGIPFDKSNEPGRVNDFESAP